MTVTFGVQPFRRPAKKGEMAADWVRWPGESRSRKPRHRRESKTMTKLFLLTLIAAALLPQMALANEAGGGTGQGPDVTVVDHHNGTVILANDIVSIVIDTTKARLDRVKLPRQAPARGSEHDHDSDGCEEAHRVFDARLFSTGIELLRSACAGLRNCLCRQ